MVKSYTLRGRQRHHFDLTSSHIDSSMSLFQWGVGSADSLPVCWLLCSLTDVTVNRLASIIISVSQCTGNGWGPVRLPFCLGSLCSPADVNETHLLRGSQTDRRHPSQLTQCLLCQNKALVPVQQPSDCRSMDVSGGNPPTP